MPVPSAISDLSQTAGSNYPAGSESPTTADDYLRTYASYIAKLRDGQGFTSPVTVASAATTDIGGQVSQAVEISGTTTITSFGTNYSGARFVKFTGALTLTHNATSLVLPGGANIATVAGDTCVVVPNQALNGWTVIAYAGKSGHFSSLTASGQITSTVSTGTAPFVVASTTKVANLNVDQLDGGDWASPGAIGSTTPSTGAFTTLSATGQIKAGSGGATPTAQLANVTPSGTEAALELYQTGVESWKIKNLASSTDLVFANSGTERVRLIGTGGVSVTGALSATTNAIVGTAATTNAVLVNGIASGSASGASVIVQNAGSPLIAIGNKSALLGGAYDATPYIYHQGTLTTQGAMAVTGALSATGDVGVGGATLTGGTSARWLTTDASAGSAYGGGLISALNGVGKGYVYYSNSFSENRFIMQGAPGIGLGFRANSSTTDHLTIDTAGNLGLGAASPGGKLHVRTSPGAVGLVLDANTSDSNSAPPSIDFRGFVGSGQGARIAAVSSGTGWGRADLCFYTSSTASDTYTPVERGRFANDGVFKVATTQTSGAGNVAMFGDTAGSMSGRVVIGTSDTNVPAIAISNWDGATTTYGPRIGFDNSGLGGFSIGGADGVNAFDIARTWGTPDVRIDSNGNFLVGQTGVRFADSRSFDFDKVDGGAYFNHATGDPSGNYFCAFGYAAGLIGSITQSGTTAVAYNTTSDHRLKENVRPADAARFMDIEFVDFEWTDGRHDCGVIAHQLQSVYPDLVLGEKDATDDEGKPVYQQVNYMGLIGRMGTRIQQQQRLIEAMEARLAALEAA